MRANEREQRKKQRGNGDASRPQGDTLVRDQCSSCGELGTVARRGWCKQKERESRICEGEEEQFVLDVLEYKTSLKQSPQRRNS